MNILGVGIDIENISRFRKLPYKKYKNFYNKIFTESELKYCLSKKDPYPHFAARFSVKEAVIKALSKPVMPKDIEVIRKPNAVNVRIKNRKDLIIFASLSHAGKYSAAIVISVRSD